MTVVVTHTTPADSTFSSTGAAAWNANHALSGVGTMAEQDANNVAITGGAINGTTVGATTPAAGTFTTLTATGQTILGGTSGAEGLRVVPFASQTSRLEITGGLNGGKVQSYVAGTGNTELWQSSLGTGAIRFQTNSGAQEQLRINHTASAVNYHQLTGSATGSGPIHSVAGSDTNIDINFNPKGTGQVKATNTTSSIMASVGQSGYGSFLAQGSTGNAAYYFGYVGSSEVGRITMTGNTDFGTSSAATLQLRVAHTASAVNYVQVTGAATGSGPTISAQGSDTNADLNLITKNAGSATIYTPTSVGGTSSNSQNIVNFQGVASGNLVLLRASLARHTTSADWTGVGYRFGHVVDTTAMSYIEFNPVGQSQGLAVNVANSSPFQVKTTGGEQLRVSNTASAVNYVQITGGSPTISAQGSDTNIGLNLSTKGTGGFNFASSGNSIFSGNGGTHFRVRTDIASASNFWEVFGSTSGPIFRSTSTTGLIQTSGGALSLQTDAAGTTQLNVAHTASAVNYVQVTGSVTGGRPLISVQGSDTNINMGVLAKGSGVVYLQSGSGASLEASATGNANYFSMVGTAAGIAPVLTVKGSDTDIPLVLQPKGTGALQAQQTDSTTTGGNARGANAVDWQTSRSAAGQVASGPYAVISGGIQNTSSSNFSVVCGGIGNIASGGASVVIGGQNSQATNTYAIAGGGGNVATGNYSIALGGYGLTSAGFYSTIVGGQQNSATSGSAVTTQSATMNGTTAVTLAASNASIKVGQYITGTSIASFTYVAAISGTSLTLSQAASGSSTSTLSFYTPHGVVVGGGNNQATGSYSFIGGGGDAGTAGNKNRASGDWSFVGGGQSNTASGTGSFIGGGGIINGVSAGNAASGDLSFIGGGRQNNASGTESCIIAGVANFASGNVSTVLGGRLATTRGIIGNVVGSASESPIGGNVGNSQFGILVLGKETTNATATVLTSNGGAGSTNNQVILPNNSAYFFTGEVVAGVTGGGNTKGWTIEGVIKRGANAAATTLIGTTVTSMYADVGAATWTIAVTADTTNGGLAVTFTGQASTTIRTVCQIRTTEMTY